MNASTEGVPDRQRGVTLLELMIVVVIIAILAAIAYPSYVEHVRRSARSEAETVLMQLSQAMERNFTEAGRYDQNSAGAGVTAGMFGLAVSPITGTARYNITFSAGPTQTTFTAQAAPTGPQTGDICGNLTLTETGVKGAGGSIAVCWGQ